MRQRAYRNRTNRHHDGKKAYPDEHSAKAGAAMAQLKYGVEQRAYLCRNCNQWHTGTIGHLRHNSEGGK